MREPDNARTHAGGAERVQPAEHALRLAVGERQVGRVLEHAELAADQINKGQYEVVYPSVSIQAEPPVAVVDKNAAKHGTTAVATAYLQYLYSPAGQEIAAKHFYRPHDAAVAAKYARQFPNITLFTAEKVFGGWDQIQKTHFADGGTFDQISRR